MVRITKRAVSRSLHPLIKRPTFSFDKTLLVTGSDSVQSLFPIHYSLDYSFYDIIYLPRETLGAQRVVCGIWDRHLVLKDVSDFRTQNHTKCILPVP